MAHGDIPVGNIRIKPVDNVTYLGFTICSLKMHTQQILIVHIERRITLPNCLYMFLKMLTNSNKSKIPSILFRFAKYLLRFPPWTSSSYLARKFSITDPIIAVDKEIRSYDSRSTKLIPTWLSVLAQQLRCICCVFFLMFVFTIRMYFFFFYFFSLVSCSVISFLCMTGFPNNNNYQ